MKSVCLAILNYNGRKHLEHLLPTACAAAKNYSGSCSVLVLDNRSTELDVEWVKREFPSVQAVVAPKNDFLFSYNWLLAQLRDEVVVLLNNDLRVGERFLDPLIRHFQSSDVFAVSASSYDWEGRERTIGPARLRSHHGIYHWDYERERQELCHTLFCSGGFMAVDRKKFLHLGGFNRLFWPGYAEDLDLGFRAWRRGWRSIFEPASVVLHRESGTWGSSNDGCAARLMLRASLLFQWSSLPRATSRVERTAFIYLTATRKLLHGQSWWAHVWIATWLEWQRLRKSCHAMETSSEELNTILARMAEPIPAPRE
jgi:GT2 family glycosyltransferase